MANNEEMQFDPSFSGVLVRDGKNGGMLTLTPVINGEVTPSLGQAVINPEEDSIVDAAKELLSKEPVVDIAHNPQLKKIVEANIEEFNPACL